MLVSIGSFTDSVALTVAISAIVAWAVFGRTSISGGLDAEAREHGRMVTGEGRVWLAYQEGFVQASLVGLASGIIGAWLVTIFAAADPALGAFGAPPGLGVFLGFGISAFSLIFLQFGFPSHTTRRSPPV